jgi:hypothetical protein
MLQAVVGKREAMGRGSDMTIEVIPGRKEPQAENSPIQDDPETGLDSSTR